MADKATRETWALYRRVFGTPDGQAVLVDLLNDLGWFASDPAAIEPVMLAEANTILRRLGANDISNFKQMVEGIMQTLPQIGGEDE
ncbi:MAG: hypothetical protein MR519_10665 [Spirochaetaceae bacterium]|nr:hypothetical protein [Spirochaetaceae bacterium]